MMTRKYAPIVALFLAGCVNAGLVHDHRVSVHKTNADGSITSATMQVWDENNFFPYGEPTTSSSLTLTKEGDLRVEQNDSKSKTASMSVWKAFIAFLAGIFVCG